MTNPIGSSQVRWQCFAWDPDPRAGVESGVATYRFKSGDEVTLRIESFAKAHALYDSIQCAVRDAKQEARQELIEAMQRCRN